MLASADMSMISAGALLYKLDGHKDKPTLATLVNLGYVPRTIQAQNYRLHDNLSVTSTNWGSLAELEPIETSAITTATSAEAAAYQTLTASRTNTSPPVLRSDRHAAGRCAGRRAGTVDVHPAARRQRDVQRRARHPPEQREKRTVENTRLSRRSL